MKKLQSIVAGLLSVCLLTCSASAMSFPDVPKDSPYATAIENISDLGIMVGGSNGNFNPDQIVSRCEMATIICRMLGTTEDCFEEDRGREKGKRGKEKTLEEKRKKTLFLQGLILFRFGLGNVQRKPIFVG